MYDLDALEAELAGTTFAGKLHFNPVTGSTNTDALTAARDGAPDGSVFFADEQTAGRGRGDHRWQSNAGDGLYVSVLMRPKLSPAQLPRIPLVAGLAAAQAIKAAAGLVIDLRWPNDLLIAADKVGGILVESKTDASGLAFAVIGIGINVHQRSFDPAHSTPATSLDIASGQRVSRQSLLIALLKSLEHEMLLLSDAMTVDTTLRRVEQASTWLKGRRVEVHGPQECVGITAGLDAHGFLLVQTAEGLVTVQTGGIRAAETE
ncbi:biotin--[acetyl-CoA-carboxylase] ligase [Telmatobacter sp. DSM 110680]|uniref:biotin--[biotin carboxyl-carrier protein] ligase n=1 Tax=Telmatobacter sp. DSM 110680 TaxID=3036704 RepID=A0AAU7DLD2_9BACT